MSRDRIEGQGNQRQGNAMRDWGEVMNDELIAVAVKYEALVGRLHERYGIAYVADRKVRMMAEALALTLEENAATTKANKGYQTTQTEIVKNMKEDLVSPEGNATRKAEKRASDARAELAKLAAVKEEARGLVITLSGSALFAPDESTLLPSAQDRLNQVAVALMETKERWLTVEGHTDPQGSSSYNHELSQQRAEAVRSYIVARGYAADLIDAQGIGEDRPVADSTCAEGRANNRRVEIIVSF